MSLSGDARVAEVARMLGGDGAVQRKHARHLLRAGLGGEREEASA
jgi:DNA repair ATPase RecN